MWRSIINEEGGELLSSVEKKEEEGRVSRAVDAPGIANAADEWTSHIHTTTHFFICDLYA